MAAMTRKARAAAAANANTAGTSAATTHSGDAQAKAGSTLGHDTRDPESGQVVKGAARKRKKVDNDEVAVTDDDDRENPRKRARSESSLQPTAQKRKLQLDVDDTSDRDQDAEGSRGGKRSVAAKSQSASTAPAKSKRKTQKAADEDQPAEEHTDGGDGSAPSPADVVARGRQAGRTGRAPPQGARGVRSRTKARGGTTGRKTGQSAQSPDDSPTRGSDAEFDEDAGIEPESEDAGSGERRSEPPGRTDEADDASQFVQQTVTAEIIDPDDDDDDDEDAFVNDRALSKRKRKKALGQGEPLKDEPTQQPVSAAENSADEGDPPAPKVNLKSKTAAQKKAAAAKSTKDKPAPSRKATVEDYVSAAENSADEGDPPAPKPKALTAAQKKAAAAAAKSTKDKPAPSRKATVEDYVSEAEDSADEGDPPAPKVNLKSKTAAQKKAAAAKTTKDKPAPSRKATVEDYVSAAENSADEGDPPAPKPKALTAAQKKAAAAAKSTKDKPAPSRKATVEDYVSEDEDDLVAAKPKKTTKSQDSKVKAKKSKSVKQKQSESDETVSSAEVDAEVAELDADETKRAKRHTKPGPLTKEEGAEFEEHVREFEQWMIDFAARTGKSLEYLWNLSRIKFKLKRDRSIWNMFQERWSMENPRQDNESLDAYHERRRAAYAEVTSGKTKKQKAALKKELVEWSEKCDEELAKLTIEAGDMFKVMHRLGDDIDGLTRPYWSNYHIAVFGFMLCVDKADVESIAMNGCFSNTPVARKWLTGKHVNVRSLLADFANLFGVHLLNEAEKDDWSRDAYGRFATAKGQEGPRDTVKSAFRFWRKLLRGEPPPGDKGEIPWLKIEGEVLVAHKRVCNWPDDVALPSEAKGRWLVDSQKKLMRYLFQSHRLTTGTLEEKEDSISPSGADVVVNRNSPDFDPKKILVLEDLPQSDLDKMGTDWDGWYNTAIWTTRSGKVLLHVGDILGKVTRYNNIFPQEMIRPEKRKVEGFDDDEDVKPEGDDEDVKRKAGGSKRIPAKKAPQQRRNAIGGGHRSNSLRQVSSADGDDADNSASDDEDARDKAKRRSHTSKPSDQRAALGKRKRDKARYPSLPSSDDEHADSESESARKPKKVSRRLSSSTRSASPPAPVSVEDSAALEHEAGPMTPITRTSPSPSSSPSPVLPASEDPPRPLEQPTALQLQPQRVAAPVQLRDRDDSERAGPKSLPMRDQAPTAGPIAQRPPRLVPAVHAAASSSSLAGALTMPHASTQPHARARSEAPSSRRVQGPPAASTARRNGVAAIPQETDSRARSGSSQVHVHAANLPPSVSMNGQSGRFIPDHAVRGRSVGPSGAHQSTPYEHGQMSVIAPSASEPRFRVPARQYAGHEYVHEPPAGAAPMQRSQSLAPSLLRPADPLSNSPGGVISMPQSVQQYQLPGHGSTSHATAPLEVVPPEPPSQSRAPSHPPPGVIMQPAQGYYGHAQYAPSTSTNAELPLETQPVSGSEPVEPQQPPTYDYAPIPPDTVYNQDDSVPTVQPVVQYPGQAPMFAYGYEDQAYGLYASRAPAQQLHPVNEQTELQGHAWAPQSSMQEYWSGAAADREVQEPAHVFQAPATWTPAAEPVHTYQGPSAWDTEATATEYSAVATAPVSAGQQMYVPHLGHEPRGASWTGTDALSRDADLGMYGGDASHVD